MRAQLQRRLVLLALAAGQVLAAAAALALAITTLVGLALVLIAWGLPLVLVSAALTRPLADLQRRWAGAILGQPVASPYLGRTERGPVGRFRELLRDPARRRDVGWLLVHGTVGLALAIVAILEAVVDLLLWWLPPGLCLRLLALLARALLDESESSRLALRVQQLTVSRTDTVDTQAAELRRIERDLHDGAQARLISLGICLGLAEEQLERDPAAARALLAEARASGGAALVELRDLVRGIHPPVLADRGLVGAVEALALAAPLRVSVHSDVEGVLSPPVESAAYFAVAEALTNVIRHSGARSAEIGLVRRGHELHLGVRDDGTGGAAPGAGSGLRGIERRLAAFDGTLTVVSPPGGPTVLHMVLPCASSSPKILPSSATA